MPNPTTSVSDATKSGGYDLNPAKLSGTTKAIDVIAHYLGDQSLVGDPLPVAFAAVYAIEAAGLRIEATP